MGSDAPERAEELFQATINAITASVVTVLEASLREDDQKIMDNFMHLILFATKCHQAESKLRGVFIYVDETSPKASVMQVMGLNADPDLAAAFLEIANESVNAKKTDRIVQ